jgi:uncharacterized protein (DUF2236 family)
MGIFAKAGSRFYAPMILENMRMGVRALQANVVRTFLTMLGVIIGVACGAQVGLPCNGT